MKPIKLFCIPYSGGSAEVYLKWRKYLSNYITLCPVEIAGRGKRIRDLPYDKFEDAIEDIASVIVSQLRPDDEYAIFGHSMGSLLAFETYYKLMEKGCHAPCHMFFTGRKAPQNLNIKTSYYLLPDKEFLEVVLNYGGNTKEIMEDEDLLKLFLPILRSDFKIVETYIHMEKKEKIPCDMTVINGCNDRSIFDFDMNEWKLYAGNQCVIIKVMGDHFFIIENCACVVDIINDTLERCMYV